MERASFRCLIGSALAIAILNGCASQRPFTDSYEDQRWRDPPPALAGASVLAARSDDGAATPTLDEDATLGDYLRFAALHNPGLEAMFHEWRALVERLPQAGVLPDPRFTYGYYLGELETRVGPMKHQVSLSQTFPWFGKLQDREDAAARHASAAYERFEAARLALNLSVERAYNELYLLKRSIEVTNENIELLQQFERIANTRYRVDTADHPGIIRIQLELATLEDRLAQLRSLRAPYSARLNSALGRSSDIEVPWPSEVSERIVQQSGAVLLEALERRNPELFALEEEIKRERINTEIARKEGYPDLTFGLAYTVIDERPAMMMPENGDDAVLGTVSINVPIWREKYDAGVREAIARRMAAAARRGDKINQLASELQEAIFTHSDAQRRIALYRQTLIPKATETLQASLAGLGQGQADFLDVVETQRSLLEFELAIARAQVDRATSYARIEQLVGCRLEDLTETADGEVVAP